MLFLNSWRASATLYSATTHPPAIQKQHWQSREAQIELPLIECEWAFRIRRLIKGAWQPSYDSCLITEHSYSYPMERLVWGLSHGTHSVNIPCGRKPEYQEKPTTFGRALRIEPTISHVKGACSDDCDTKATIYFPARKQEHCLKVMDFWRFYRYTVDCHFPSRYRLNIVQIPWISFLVSLFLAVIVYLMFSSAFNRCVSLNVRHQKNERQVQYNFRRFLFC
jgi:hypothetical protein